jgi:hypothetical protein
MNPNVMHEVGYSLGRRDKFIVLIARKDQRVPANLGDLTVLRYSDKGPGWQRLAASEINALATIYQSAANNSSPQKRRRLVGPMKIRHD